MRYFPLYVTLSEFVNLLIGLAIFFVLFLILKGAPTIFILLLPLAILLQMMFTLSLAFFPLQRGGLFPGYSPDAGGDLFDLVLGNADCLYRKPDPVRFPVDRHLEPGVLYAGDLSGCFVLR